jgi:hypothetical protein
MMTNARRRLFLPLAGLALLLLACQALGAKAGPPRFPEKIGPLSLVRVVTKQQAEGDLNSIHDEKIKVADAAIAHYAGGGATAVVWWSRAASEAEGRRQLERMTAKIGPAGYGYGQHRELKLRGTLVHAYLKGGQVHYTYRQADQLYWIAAPPGLIDAVFEALMK